MEAHRMPAKGPAQQQTTGHGDEAVREQQQRLLPRPVALRRPSYERGHGPTAGEQVHHPHQREDLDEHQVGAEHLARSRWLRER
jgi:hypothetical protein